MIDRALALLLGPRFRLTPLEAGERLRRAGSVLLVKPHVRIGDLLVDTPVIRNLRVALPRARLVFLAGPYNAPAVRDHPDLDEVVTVPVRGPAALRAWPVVRRLRRERFDAALVLSTIAHSTTAVVLARACRPGFTAGFDDGGAARACHECVLEPPADPLPHRGDFALTLLERLGIPVPEKRHFLGVTPEQLAAGREALVRAGADPGRPLLGVQLGGNPRHRWREWPPGSYAAVIARARDELSYDAVLFGLPGDVPLLDEVERAVGASLPRLVGLPFGVYKGALAGLRYFLTHDGGPMHIAPALGVPTYIVLRHTPPWGWAPRGDHVAVWEEYERVPSPEEVWEGLAPELRRRAASSAESSQ